MTDAAKLRARFAALPVEARPSAAELLAQISHDIKGPIATLTMECFSAKMLLGQASQHVGAPIPQAQTLVKQLDEISRNLARASDQLSAYLAVLGTLDDSGNDLADE